MSSARKSNGRGFSGGGLKQEDLYNTGMPDDNPFQSMYQATIGGNNRAQTSYQNGFAAGGRPKTYSQTPAAKRSSSKIDPRWNSPNIQKSMSKSSHKLNVAAKRDQHRRFGEYNGEDGLEYEPHNTQSIWNQSACK